MIVWNGLEIIGVVTSIALVLIVAIIVGIVCFVDWLKERRGGKNV